VFQLYQRSIEKRKLRYIPFIGDRDSSSYNCICIEKPFGETVFIPKVDCIVHVTKRMGTNLRSLVRDYKGNF
jgi:phosphopantetheine adenylyltransferase